MSFQADFSYPDPSLEGSSTFYNPSIFSCPVYDPYTNSQDTSTNQVPQLAFDPMLSLLSAVQDDSTPWEMWPEFSGSDYQLVPPQDQQSVSVAHTQESELSVQPSCEEKGLKEIVAELGQRVERFEQDVELRILSVEDTVSRLQMGLELEKTRLCDEIDTQIQQLQKWAGTIRGLVETATEIANMK